MRATIHYRDARIDGRWTRVRVTGLDYDTAAGVAAARSIGRRASAVYGVTDDGRSESHDSVTRHYVVTVTTGRCVGDVHPVQRVRVSLDTTPRADRSL